MQDFRANEILGESIQQKKLLQQILETLQNRKEADTLFDLCIQYKTEIQTLKAENEQVRQGNEDLQRRCRELEKIVERETPTGQKD